MSAEDEVLRLRMEIHTEVGNEHQIQHLLDEFEKAVLHEATEKIRASRLESPEGFTVRESWVDAWSSGRDDSADMIDPYVK